MELKSLAIDSIRGFQGRGLFYPSRCLSPGLNLVFGKNGTGKTTTCQAIRLLLWDFPHEDQTQLLLRSTWEVEGKDLVIERRQKIRHLHPDSDLRLPPKRLAKCYTVTIEELFAAEDSDFAEEIAKALFGGYALPTLRRSPLFMRPKRTQFKERIDWQRQKQVLNKELQKQRELQVELSEMEGLNQKVEEAKEASSLLPLIDQLLQYREWENKKALIKAEMSSYPSQIGQLKGGEAEQLSSYEEALDENALKLTQLQTKIESLEKASLLFSRTDLELQERRIKEERQLEAEIHLLEGQCVQELSYLQQETEQLGIDLEALHLLTSDQLTLLGDAWDIWQRAVAQKRVLLERLPFLSENRDQTALAKFYPLLFKRSYFALFIPALFTVSLLPFILAPSLWGGLSVGITFGLLSAWFFSLKKDTSALEKELAVTLFFQEQVAIRSELEKEAKLAEQQVEKALLNLEKVQKSLGVKGDVESLKRLQKQLMTQMAHKEKLTALLKRREQKQLSFNQWLEKIGEKKCTDLLEAEAILKKMQEALSHAEATAREKTHLQKNKAQLLQEKSLLEKKREKLLTPFESEEQLFQLLKQHKPWQELEKLHFELESKQCAYREQWKDKVDPFQELSVQQLVQKRVELVQLSAQYEQLLEKKLLLEQRLFAAEKSTRVKEAMHTLHQAKKRLEEKQSAQIRLDVRNFMLNISEEQFRKESEPKLFKLANQWFTRFTLGNYQLATPELKGGTLQFFAQDTKEQIKPLHHLSLGTRMQLLFAVRLAFCLLHEEKAEPVPFFFDEVFTTADEGRFHTMATVIAEMVKEGRQVFYFTCRETDCALWKEFAQKSGLSSIQLIDLDKERAATASKHTPLLSHQVKYPEPTAGLTFAQYGEKLSIPGIDPYQSYQDVHMYHLLETPKELYTFLTTGVHTYGQWKALATSDGAKLSHNAERIQGRGKLMETFFELAERGRGKAVTRKELTEAGVSSRYLLPLLEIVQECKGSAKRLLNHLEEKKDPRLKGFRKQSFLRLKETLEKKGCLDFREPLSRKEIFFQLKPLVDKETEPFLQTLIHTVKESQ